MKRRSSPLAPVILGFVAVVAGCASDVDIGAVARPDAAPMEIVRGDDLRDVLSGARMQQAMVVGAYEHFCASGDWHQGNTRVPGRGRFEINDDQFCVMRNDAPGVATCRRLYRADSGEYLVADANTSTPDRATSTDIIRRDQPTC